MQKRFISNDMTIYGKDPSSVRRVKNFEVFTIIIGSVIIISFFMAPFIFPPSLNKSGGITENEVRSICALLELRLPHWNDTILLNQSNLKNGF